MSTPANMTFVELLDNLADFAHDNARQYEETIRERAKRFRSMLATEPVNAFFDGYGCALRALNRAHKE